MVYVVYRCLFDLHMILYGLCHRYMEIIWNNWGWFTIGFATLSSQFGVWGSRFERFFKLCSSQIALICIPLQGSWPVTSIFQQVLFRDCQLCRPQLYWSICFVSCLMFVTDSSQQPRDCKIWHMTLRYNDACSWDEQMHGALPWVGSCLFAQSSPTDTQMTPGSSRT